MKAQSFFGGTNPKDHAAHVRQAGHHSATSPNQLTNNAGSFNNMQKGRTAVPYPTTGGKVDPRHTVKQVGTTRGGGKAK